MGAPHHRPLKQTEDQRRESVLGLPSAPMDLHNPQTNSPSSNHQARSLPARGNEKGGQLGAQPMTDPHIHRHFIRISRTRISASGQNRPSLQEERHLLMWKVRTIRPARSDHSTPNQGSVIPMRGMSGNGIIDLMVMKAGSASVRGSVSGNHGTLPVRDETSAKLTASLHLRHPTRRTPTSRSEMP